MTEETTPAKRVATAKSAIENGALNMTFANGEAITVTAADIAASGIDNLLSDLAMMGLAAALRTSYSAVREDVAKSLAAAKAKLASILTDGLEGPESTGTTAAASTQIDIAIAVIAELKGRTEAEVRAIVDGYTDSEVNGTVVTAEEKRKALVAKIKNDPATAALFASKRAAAKAPKRKQAVSILDSF